MPLNFQARLGNAGGIGEREVVPVLDTATGNDLDLSVPFVVLLQGFLSDVHFCFRAAGVAPFLLCI